MIRVQTEDGPVTIDAEPKDVTSSAGHLKITRQGVIIAQFRNWQHWHETTEGTDTA
ncbi:MAG: hypothetical protein QJR09_13570 [Micrococcus sp.]|nr:hypothetical protein [Micrococcus sp.]